MSISRDQFLHQLFSYRTLTTYFIESLPAQSYSKVIFYFYSLLVQLDSIRWRLCAYLSKNLEKFRKIKQTILYTLMVIKTSHVHYPTKNLKMLISWSRVALFYTAKNLSILWEIVIFGQNLNICSSQKAFKSFYCKLLQMLFKKLQ